MTYSSKVKKILYGGDYNPEQWPEEIWAEDMRLLKEAHIDIVTLNVFNWAALQPDESTYDFSRLDRVMELVRENGLKVCLATSTGAHPAWMARKYPDVLRTEFSGMKRKFGGRHNSCPNSPTYQKYSVMLADKLAERYKGWDNIIAWHISNEYGGECYCENCEKAFRVWLRKKYKTLDALIKAWDTAFWGHTFYEWDEIVAPNILSEHFDSDRTQFQGISLDYRRFNSESIQSCFEAEYAAVKKHTPDIPVTTNLMGFYKGLDYQRWAKSMDFISWDSYPANSDEPARIAMNHDLMRGIKNQDPFVLMEQTPSATNWQDYNALKRPGVMRLLSYQAVAHGADAVMFFQMRRSAGACEKLHGAVIDHEGSSRTRVFQEVAALGRELDELGGSLLGGRTPSRAAILFDWDNWWAIEYSAGPSRELKYLDEVLNYYRAFYELNIPVDIIGTGDSLAGYGLVAAPVLYMVKPGYDEKIRTFVREGGSFITTFFSGIAEEHDLVVTGGYPGVLRDICGVWVEERDALGPGQENHFTYKDVKYPARMICDLMHQEGAECLASYEEDFYEGMPALTRNRYGNGHVYYAATRSAPEFYHEFIKDVTEEAGIKGIMETPGGVEAAVRNTEDGEYRFLLNHLKTGQAAEVDADYEEVLTKTRYRKGERMELPGKGVLILKRQK